MITKTAKEEKVSPHSVPYVHACYMAGEKLGFVHLHSKMCATFILNLASVSISPVEMKKTETAKEDAQPPTEEEEYKDYLKSLFEAILLFGEQSIPLTGPGDSKQDGLGESNFQALLEYQVSCGNQVLKKRFEAKKEYCSHALLQQLIQALEKSICRKLIEEVKENGFFSLLTDDLVRISGEWYLPVFLRYVDQLKNLQERFVGFYPFNGDGDALAENMLSDMTEKWGLDMGKCRGQAHSCSGTQSNEIKKLAMKVNETYPLAVLTLRSTCTLNLHLAKGANLSGVQLVLSTLRRIESFFSLSPLLHSELEHAISVFFPDKEEKVKELNEICRSNWTSQNDAFDVAVEILEALLLCLDSVHDNEDIRWSDEVTQSAYEISKALTDFEFVMSLVVLKNTLMLTRAFGKNLQGSAADLHSAAGSLKAVLHSLKEMHDHIEVYHEFWNDEAVNLAAALDVTVKAPRSFLRRRQSDLGAVRPDAYFRDHLSVPFVSHVIQEMDELFCEDHLKALRCLSLVPAVIEQLKPTEPDQESAQVFKDDMPNTEGLSAELHCWQVKWGKKVKGETAPTTLLQTTQLPDMKFFPNTHAILKLVSILPVLTLERDSNLAYQRYQMFMKNTPDEFKSKNLAVLNINYDVSYDLDALVDGYMLEHAGTEEW